MSQAASLRDLADDEFFFEDRKAVAANTDGYSSDDSTTSVGSVGSVGSVRSVLSNGRRVLPARILGAEIDEFDLLASDDEEPDMTSDGKARGKQGGFFQLATRAVTGVVEDLQNWHSLPFDTMAEKCEYVATRDERLPFLLLMLTLLLGVILLVAVGIGCAGKGRRGAQPVRMLSGGGNASVFSTASSVSSAPVFRLVPMSV